MSERREYHGSEEDYESQHQYDDRQDASQDGSRGGAEGRPADNNGSRRASAAPSEQPGTPKKKRARDFSDDFKSHRFSVRIPPVELPLKVLETILPDCRHQSKGSAHRHCFTFFGYGERKTTHAVKKSKVVLILATYESITVCDADRGELLRIIPFSEIESPLYCVLDERILHIKVHNEHDLVVKFAPETDANRVSHPVDILCDMMSELQFLTAADELPEGEDPSSVPRLEVREVPTSAQLIDVNLKRPSHVRYPSLRMKELLRYENPHEDEEEVQVPADAVRQIPSRLDEIPQREETFVTVLPQVRVEDLSRRLALRASLRDDKARELKILRDGNNILRTEYQSLNQTVAALRSAVQHAYQDAQEAQRRQNRAARQKSAGGQSQRQQQMKWEQGSDEQEMDDGQFSNRHEEDGVAHLDDEENEENGHFEDEEGHDEENWDDVEHSRSVRQAVALDDKKALNAALVKESRRTFKRLKVVKQKIMEAQEQAARLWTRTDCSTDAIALYEDVLLGLEFIAQEAALAEAGASHKKEGLEVKNRSLRLEMQALKLLEQVTDERDSRLVEAETKVASRRRDLDDIAAEEDARIEEQLRPIRIEQERHLAELTAYFDSEIAKSVACATVEFRTVHSDARLSSTTQQNNTVRDRAAAALSKKVSAETQEAKYLREELQKKASFVTKAICSLRDENDGLKRMMENLMHEYGMSLEASNELRTRLLDAQKSIAEERETRKTILDRTKDRIVSETQQLLKKKSEEIDRTRKYLFELQDSLQRAARTFGMGQPTRGQQNVTDTTFSLRSPGAGIHSDYNTLHRR